LPFRELMKSLDTFFGSRQAAFLGVGCGKQTHIQRGDSAHLVVAPGLVADTPELDGIRRRMAFAARHFLVEVVAAPLVYSTNSRADHASPKPALTVI
jgi:hypothetical protein